MSTGHWPVKGGPWKDDGFEGVDPFHPEKMILCTLAGPEMAHDEAPGPRTYKSVILRPGRQKGENVGSARPEMGADRNATKTVGMRHLKPLGSSSPAS